MVLERHGTPSKRAKRFLHEQKQSGQVNYAEEREKAERRRRRKAEKKKEERQQRRTSKAEGKGQR